jgi:acyl dehydratase
MKSAGAEGHTRFWQPNIGDPLPVLERGPISRGELALFAGASNDHFFIHTDSDYAKSVGLPDVIAPGMLIMAYLGHLLTSLVKRQEQILSWKVRFAAVTPIHALVRCSGVVREILHQEGHVLAGLDIVARTSDGQDLLIGEALIAL